MYFKLYESGLQRRDIWEGEDVEYYNILFRVSWDFRGSYSED